MRDKVERKLYVNIIYFVILGLVLLTNIFYGFFSKLLYLVPDIEKTDSAQIHFINVGQGDAIAIKFRTGETMLIDSGTELYRRKLTRYLDNVVLDDNRIDYLVLTHTDLDHSANMEYIISNYEIGTFYRPPVYLREENEYNYIDNENYANVINLLKNKGVNIKFNDDTEILTIGSATLRWLYPNVDNFIDSSNTNNHSAVIILEENNKKVMLTGDIDNSIEMEIINTYSNDVLDVDILKVAHHGSNSSTSTLFLETTSPEYAVISVGENTYGHPAEGLLSRILEYSGELYGNLYRTDISGNIIFTIDEDIKVETIDNIDKYSFSPYWLYTILIDILLAIVMFMPYFKVWYKKLRFIIVNALHKNKNSDN